MLKPNNFTWKKVLAIFLVDEKDVLVRPIMNSKAAGRLLEELDRFRIEVLELGDGFLINVEGIPPLLGSGGYYLWKKDLIDPYYHYQGETPLETLQALLEDVAKRPEVLAIPSGKYGV